MNTSRFRTLALLTALTIGLSACGGSNGNDGAHVDLGGTVSGLTSSGLMLRNGSIAIAVPANATTFKFAEQVSTGYAYGVTVLTQPTDATCTVTNGSGTANNDNITNVQVACALNGTLGGTVANLTGSGLVLANGNSTVAVDAGSTAFTFSSKLAPGLAYGVTVLTQPAGQTCTVANGAGTMPSANVTTVEVSCQ
jgi:hypothetical protein